MGYGWRCPNPLTQENDMSNPARDRLGAVLPWTLCWAALSLAALPTFAAQQDADAPTRTVPVESDTIFQPLPAPDPSYALLDNVEGDWVNVVAWPVRPMVVIDNADIYAANVPGNSIGHFDASLQRLDTFRTLWAPVSLAGYIHPTDGPDSDQLLVVSHLSNALVFHNRLTGDIFDVLALPAQPADIVVLQDQDLAFVSSVATDVVVEIDLVNRTILRQYAIPSRQPTYLTVTDDGEVLVAPRWSGNNSVVDRIPGNSHNTQAGPGSILDLDQPTVATQGLVDEDLFWLDQGSGQAVAVAAGMGSLLFAHGIHPTTGQLWQLNTEANNKNPALQSEPLIQGNVSFNRLTKVNLPVLGSGLVVRPTPADIIDLDLANPSGTHDRNLAVGNPYAMDFTDSGLAFVTGLLTDNVVVLDANGNWVAEWDLPTGCIPRQVLLDATDQFALVYCDGLNTVPVYFLNGVPPLQVGTMDLGFDPSPALVQEGKRIFFDAAQSANNNHSCATCHDEGRQDLLAWNLSNDEVDNKGPMVTQTLVGSNRSRHHHWRGEQLQDLLDFNDAFVGLLGGTKLTEGPGSKFEAFEAFVMSLEHPANPYQNAGRILDDSIQPPMLGATQNPNASAINGRDVYLQACEGCHHLPGGTSNDVIGDGTVFGEQRPKRQWIQVAHLWDVVNKGLQPDTSVTLAGGTSVTYPSLGFGLAHSGNPRNIFHFLTFFSGLTNAEMSDATNFLFQFDSGLAPSANAQQLMTSANVGTAQAFVNSFMIPQANARNSDLAVFGRTTISGNQRIWGWVWDRAQGMFRRDDNVLQPLSFFSGQATAGDWFVFVGQPVGMGPVFATDFDRDEFPNGFEQLTPVDGRFVKDTDGDNDWDGHEWNNLGDPFNAAVQSNDTTNPSVVGGAPNVLWTTSKVGRVTFETDELTTYSLTLTPVFPQLPTLSFSDGEFRRTHAVIMHDMFPSVPYSARLQITDLANLTNSYGFTVTPRVFTDAAETVIASNLAWRQTAFSVPAGSMQATVGATVTKKTTLGNAQDHIVVAKVLVDGVPATSTTLTSSPSAFCVNNVPYTPTFHLDPVLGPFVISPLSGSNGTTSLSFGLSGLSSGQVVTLTLEAVGEVDPNNPICPGTIADPNMIPGGTANPLITSPRFWSFPDTPKAFRAITIQVP